MQITSVVEWCKKNAYKAIAVQLPDSMLGCAVRLHTALNDHFGEEHTVYLLADSTYARWANVYFCLCIV
jgi:diphthamide biosynthesis enzyme Dph1/Dph2-like protein